MQGIASKSELQMSFLRYALFTVPAVVLLGTLSGLLSNSGYANPWFAALVKPGFMPPGWMFAVAWTTLYTLLGLSLAMLLHAKGARRREKALILFALQLLLNFAWSPLFFWAHKVSLALSVIAAMVVVAVFMVVVMWRIRSWAAALILPYLCWLLFALTLNYQILILNPDAETLEPGPARIDIQLNGL
ncbi:MAG: translocator protein [Sphingomonadales bacterium]|jgi:tryptophan-rich sensory protein|nr:translocator protein [Sphingomonadales bacterium]